MTPAPTPNGGVPPGALLLQKPEAVAIAQALYNAVTGKTEKLAKSFSKSYIIRQEDIKQLHMKCTQACNQWTVLKRNENVTVHHVDDNKETFSSFDRFLAYDASQTAPTEAVVYELNILLTIPASEKPQNYRVVVRMVSRVSIMSRMQEDSAPPQFMRMFGGSAILVEIEYVDYVIARSLVAMVDSWVKEVEVSSSWGWAKWLQRYSFYFDDFSLVICLAAATLAMYKAAPSHLALGAIDTTKWMIAAIGTILVVGQIGRVLGIFIANQVDDVMEISAIKLNRGDEKMLTTARRKNVLSLIYGFICALFIAGQAAFCDSIVGKFIAWIKG